MSLKDWIDSDKYYLTLFDLWLLVQRYRIPTIFIRNTENSIIYQTDKLGDKKNIFIGYGHLTDDFVFINMPGYFAAVPNIAYIHSKEDGHIFIPLDKLNQNCIVKVKDINVNYTERIRDAITGQTSVEDYLKNFKGGSLGTIILDDNGYDDNLHYGGNKTKKNKSKNHNITKRH
jgi:hypothetical protein